MYDVIATHAATLIGERDPTCGGGERTGRASVDMNQCDPVPRFGLGWDGDCRAALTSTNGTARSQSSSERTRWRDIVGGTGDEKRRSHLRGEGEG